MGSGPINVQVTNTEYDPGERILVLGSTSPNVILNIKLINPNGEVIKSLDIPSQSDGTFKVEQFKIPNNADPGKWKINASSGSNLDTVEFDVIGVNQEKIVITIGEKIDFSGFGEGMKFGITTTQKTSVTLEITDENENMIGDTLSCVPTSDYKCEIFWTIPENIVPGTYIVKVTDSIVTSEKTFEIE